MFDMISQNPKNVVKKKNLKIVLFQLLNKLKSKIKKVGSQSQVHLTTI